MIIIKLVELLEGRFPPWMNLNPLADREQCTFLVTADILGVTPYPVMLNQGELNHGLMETRPRCVNSPDFLCPTSCGTISIYIYHKPWLSMYSHDSYKPT